MCLTAYVSYPWNLVPWTPAPGVSLIHTPRCPRIEVLLYEKWRGALRLGFRPLKQPTHPFGVFWDLSTSGITFAMEISALVLCRVRFLDQACNTPFFQVLPGATLGLLRDSSSSAVQMSPDILGPY